MKKDCEFRIGQAKSVANEIVQICKSTDINMVRLRYVKLLMNSCLDSKVKFGCGLWNVNTKKEIIELNLLKINLVKRVLEMPLSTPSVAIQYEFGIGDLHMEILMEKIIMAVEVMQMDDSKVCKQLLSKLMVKKVDGFCCEVKDAISVLRLENFEALVKHVNIRYYLKRELIKMNQKIIRSKMMALSKTDMLLMNNWSFDGKVKRYLLELPFDEARVVFMLRTKMLPTRMNFRGRWGDTKCKLCGDDNSDVHLFWCAGYKDLVQNTKYEMFFDDKCKTEKLSEGAKCLSRIVKRLEQIQSDN